MYNRLITFIDRNNVLYYSQYGFRKNHSTEHALIARHCQHNSIKYGSGLIFV